MFPLGARIAHLFTGSLLFGMCFVTKSLQGRSLSFQALIVKNGRDSVGLSQCSGASISFCFCWTRGPPKPIFSGPSAMILQQEPCTHFIIFSVEAVRINLPLLKEKTRNVCQKCVPLQGWFLQQQKTMTNMSTSKKSEKQVRKEQDRIIIIIVVVTFIDIKRITDKLNMSPITCPP